MSVGRGRVEEDRPWEDRYAAKLVPHPWDQVGQPPPLAGAYPTRGWDRQVERINKLLKEAAEAEYEAEEKRREAEDEENAAADARVEAEDIVHDEIEAIDPVFANRAIKQINGGAKAITT